MDFYFFVGSSCFRSEACMAEYAASEGGGGAPGITAPVALCIVLSRVVSLTTADSRSAFASSELRFLLLRFFVFLFFAFLFFCFFPESRGEGSLFLF